ncbi:LPS-induced tumor necrosis factor alpha factor [Penicillium atrosanguineum]|uniref:LPS-induced tumor necrosis factor alpha factor n=1 Tax=Penicillium atrosanguineum TaxID=1132637 RepID=A0A9W9GS42_9EURO|nr:LPS-induced tumor necrosis factor alpha factor [Penicillium atrosanguineum]KAJ5330286.1 LPS-induced tumor necrosis factor alpha factor [Penicillium atrosanguineum]
MAEHNQTNNQNSEGLTPLTAPPYSGTSPVSPIIGSKSIQPAPSEATGAYSEKPPLHGDYNAPTPIHTDEYTRAYQKQPYPDQINGPSVGQYLVNLPSDIKAYPGQPTPQIQQQPGAYYTPHGQPTGHATATPLHALLSAPCPVDCPCFGKCEMTRIEAVSGTKTHGWAAVLCCCCCLGCIPYLMSSLKDVNHYCGQCSAKLAIWHNSGLVEVLQTGQRK